MDYSNESDYQLTPKEIEHLLETQRALNAFLTEMSSEVRAPTTIIVSYSGLLLGEEIGRVK